jgi:RNA polymerase sigma-70 factor (ECF subfamily)
MDDGDWLTLRFEENRAQLRAVAYRMLGSRSEADDAVQEAWLRLNRADTSDVTNLGGWLTTTVGRVCLDILRSRASRASRREQPIDEHLVGSAGGVEPEQQALLADTVGAALLVVLDALAPAERLAFVLHDMFAVPFEDIALILDRSPAAARQLASRGRRRVQGAREPAADPGRQRDIVAAFLAASRNGEFTALLELLDPDVVLRADTMAVRLGAPGAEIRGNTVVAESFSGRATAAQLALINGVVGAVWAPRGRPRVVLTFTLGAGRITRIEVVAEPEALSQLDVEVQ